jgi:hypothetical protein
MFIKKIDLTADSDQMQACLDTVLTMTEWGVENQIGLSHRTVVEKDIWKDCVGSLYDRETGLDIANEQEFSTLNSNIPDYLKSKLAELAIAENIGIGRVRFMRLLPKTGLSVHADTSVRYHFVLKTNPHAYIAHTFHAGHVSALCFHIPADGSFYKVDTTKQHFVYNGGPEPRIHLVICPIQQQ